ncbi:hypothetical protein MMPV_004102 [Pyropia vietnamensis]
MKLDATALRYLEAADFRALTAIEMGMRNHELVSTPLIASLAGLRGGNVSRCLSTLHRHSLVHRDRTHYEGYRLTTLGYDYLAMHALQRRGALLAVGRTIGVGKEADVFVCTSSAAAMAAGRAARGSTQGAANEEGSEDEGVQREEEDGGELLAPGASPPRSVAPTADGDEEVGETATDAVAVAMKVHRLGRTSFRAVKAKRDYLRPRQSAGSWMYFSRLAAVREFAFLSALYARGFPVPVPIAASRHIVVMELVAGTPLHQVRDFDGGVTVAAATGRALVRFCADLAAAGLVHCDLNEHNVMVGSDGGVDGAAITVIDFPQVVSVGHRCAREWWERDVRGVRSFFGARFGVPPEELLPEVTWEAVTGGEEATRGRGVRIDDALQASGFDRDVLAEGALVPGAVPEGGGDDEWEWRQDRQDEGSGSESFSGGDAGDDGDDGESPAASGSADGSPAHDDGPGEVRGAAAGGAAAALLPMGRGPAAHTDGDVPLAADAQTRQPRQRPSDDDRPAVADRDAAADAEAGAQAFVGRVTDDRRSSRGGGEGGGEGGGGGSDCGGCGVDVDVSPTPGAPAPKTLGVATGRPPRAAGSGAAAPWTRVDAAAVAARVRSERGRRARRASAKRNVVKNSDARKLKAELSGNSIWN